jgi:hypothetical protein
LAALSLLRLGTVPAQLTGAQKFLEETGRQGNWKAETFCGDPEKVNGQPGYAGCEALTVAICLEALAGLAIVPGSEPESAPNHPTPDGEPIRRKITDLIESRLTRLPTFLREQAQPTYERVLRIDAKQPILLLPWQFRQALLPDPARPDDERIVALGAATLYGWMAYTLYDDFIDAEGDPALLPLANVCLRELSAIFQGCMADIPAFTAMFHDVMDRLEAANAWEVQACRLKWKRGRLQFDPESLPDYGDYSVLADRSLGHALGPLAVVCAAGYDPADPAVTGLCRFFTHYLIARQLNDDLHDWRDDLASGVITVVVSRLLKEAHACGRIASTLSKSHLADLQEFFWTDTAAPFDERILDEVAKARAAAEMLPFKPAVFETLLEPVENAAKQALAGRKENLEFLAAYQTGPTTGAPRTASHRHGKPSTKRK